MKAGPRKGQTRAGPAGVTLERAPGGLGDRRLAGEHRPRRVASLAGATSRSRWCVVALARRRRGRAGRGIGSAVHLRLRDLTRIAWRPARRRARARLPATSTNRGPSNGWRPVTRELDAGADAALGEVAQHLRIAVGDPGEGRRAPGLELGERTVSSGAMSSSALGIGSPWGSMRGIAELLGDPPLEVLGDVVLEHLGLVVDLVPRHPERLGEVGLDQPVVSDHLERDPLPGLGQDHAVVGPVLDQAQLGHPLQHRGHGPR